MQIPVCRDREIRIDLCEKGGGGESAEEENSAVEVAVKSGFVDN
jgi:hypothetical protein